jgi:hypothetical protein
LRRLGGVSSASGLDDERKGSIVGRRRRFTRGSDSSELLGKKMWTSVPAPRSLRIVS